MLKDMYFCHFQEIHPTNMGKRLLDTAIKTGIDALKTASKKLFDKPAEAKGEFIGNKIVDTNLCLLRIPEILKKKLFHKKRQKKY